MSDRPQIVFMSPFAPFRSFIRRTLALVLVLSLSVLATARLAGAAQGEPPVAAAPRDAVATAAIAYSTGNGDQIRLIAPDGSNDRLLWAHGLADPNSVYNVSSIAWRPNAAEVAFASSHEGWCSINDRDIYAVAADGSGYRRITESPACGRLASYPKGTVRIPVSNESILGDSFAGFVYFQGAPSAKAVNLPPGGSTVLTFENVADFGPGFPQVAAMIVGYNRAIGFESAIDVVAGQTVTTEEMGLYVPDIYWEARSPTWRSDNSRLGYILNFNSLRKLPPNPTPLDFGEPLQTDQAAMPDFVDLLVWGPPSRANQLLYAGNVAFDAEGIYLLSEGSASGGERLLAYEVWEQVRGLAWLPDGSGFIFSVEDDADTFQAVRANLFEYNLTTRQVRPITSFSDNFTGQLSISPDGSQIVFERAANKEPDAATSLWTVNRDGTGLRQLVPNGRTPAWSPGALAEVRRAFLPAMLGSQ